VYLKGKPLIAVENSSKNSICNTLPLLSCDLIKSEFYFDQKVVLKSGILIETPVENVPNNTANGTDITDFDVGISFYVLGLHKMCRLVGHSLDILS